MTKVGYIHWGGGYSVVWSFGGRLGTLVPSGVTAKGRRLKFKR
mgnify:CR=1 FL=1